MSLRAIVDYLFPPDPGLLRLTAAVRATVAGLATFFVAMALGPIADIDVLHRVLGFATAMFLAAMVPEGDLRSKLTTMLLGGVGAAAATTISSTFMTMPIASAVVLPAVMLVLSWLGTRGPRFMPVALVSLMSYIITLVSHETLDTVPQRLLVLAFAVAIAALVRCALMPERPEAELEHLRQAVRNGISEALGRIAAAVSSGGWTPDGRALLRRDIDRLDEVVLLAQRRLAHLAARFPAQGSRWLQLLEIQLAVERVARIALSGVGRPEDRAALLARLAVLRATPEKEVPAGEAGPLGSALDLLGRAFRDAPRTTLLPPSAPAANETRGDWRPALQTALAAAIAVACSEMILPDRWYWAAFTAFVMFQGTRSRGESVSKGISFMAGTLLGVLAGVVLAAFLAPHEYLCMAGVIVAVFLAFQAQGASFAAVTFWFTVILGLMLGMMGYFTFPVMLLRLEESMIGAAAGALVACFVLVRREGTVTSGALKTFLGALDAVVAQASAMLLDRKPVGDLPQRITAAEQAFRALSAAAASQRSALLIGHDPTLRRHLTLLAGCEHWARELATLCLEDCRLGDPGAVDLARRTAANIHAMLQTLLASGDAPGPAVGTDASAPSDADPLEGAADQDARAVRLLLRIEAALARLVPSARPRVSKAEVVGTRTAA